jgi:ketosteroid isomerase-like protein
MNGGGFSKTRLDRMHRVMAAYQAIDDRGRSANAWKRDVMKPNSEKSDEAVIRALMDAWTEAVRSRDIDKLMEHYAPDVVVFDLTQASYVGAARYRQNMEGWFSAWQGPILCERRDLTITAGSDVAFSCSLTHNSGTGPGGEKIDFWVRVTVGFRKIDGQWKVTHEHVSMPFDMETIKTSPNPEP